MTTLARRTRFDYQRPATLSEALEMLAARAPKVRPLAGGTDVLVEYRAALSGHTTLVDVGSLAELRRVEVTEAGLEIGAATSHTDIMRHPLIAEYAPAMVAAARATGSVQIRNRGTIGGNLCTAVPAMDGGPTLLALDAVATIAGPDGRRRVPIGEMFTGPRATVLAPTEILVSVTVPTSMLGRPQAFWKFGLRKGQALALVNAAATVGRGADGSPTDPRIALGAVAPTIVRARSAEEVLGGAGELGDYQASMDEATEAALADIRPIDDFRASADYRRRLVRVGIARVVSAAAAEAARSIPGGEG